MRYPYFYSPGPTSIGATGPSGPSVDIDAPGPAGDELFFCIFTPGPCKISESSSADVGGDVLIAGAVVSA